VARARNALISSPGIRMRLSTQQISDGYRHAWDCKAIRGAGRGEKLKNSEMEKVDVPGN